MVGRERETTNEPRHQGIVTPPMGSGATKISTFIHSQLLDEICQIKSFIQRTCEGDDAKGGVVQTPTPSFYKIEPRVLAINSKPFLMTNLEIK